VTNIATILRSARRVGRLTQRDLAHRAGVPQSRIALAERRREEPRFDTASRLLAGTGHRLYAAATTRDDVATITSAIREALAVENTQLAFRYFIQMNDNLVAEHGLLRGVLAVAEPESTGSKTWDSAIAALVAYRLNQDGVPHPDWVGGPGRRIARTRALRIDTADPLPPLDEVPAEFLDHGVLIWRDSLESV
jgi:transcriptional regulator with XRE-family HTH domain